MAEMQVVMPEVGSAPSMMQKKAFLLGIILPVFLSILANWNGPCATT